MASAFNESLNNDGALDAYAETVVWRLHGVHAMVRFVNFPFSLGQATHVSNISLPSLIERGIPA